MLRDGFAFVEVLAECPVHLGLEPEEAESWVREQMEPVFPLGVKKDDTESGGYPPIPSPNYAAELVLGSVGASDETPPRFAEGFPDHLDRDDISFKFAGSGGDGAQTAAMILTRCVINEGFDATHIPSYGPQSRGGTSYADVHVARDEVLSPAAPDPHVLVAFNAPSLAKFGPSVRAGGTIVYDSSVIDKMPDDLAAGVRCVGVPCTTIANDLGSVIAKNVVVLGALQGATGVFPAEAFLASIRGALYATHGVDPAE